MISRRLLLAIIAMLLVLLNSYYYCSHAAHQIYLENAEAIEGMEGSAQISGEVSAIYPDGFLLEIKSGARRKTIEIESDVEVGKGDHAEVLGLILGGKMYPEKMVVKDRWSYLAIFIISALALPLVGYLFFRSWIFDFKIWRFRKIDA